MKKFAISLVSLMLAYAHCCCAQSGKDIVSQNCKYKIFAEALTRIGVEVPVGYGLSALAAGSYIDKDIYVKGGLKRYFRAKKYEDMFVEVVAFYKNATYKISDNLRVRDSTGNDHPGSSFDYEVNKRVFGLNFEIGENLTLRHKRVKFEWYAGAGFRIKTVGASITKDFQSYELYHYNESIIDYFNTRQIAGQWLPNISLGFRMSYVFKNKRKRSS